MKTRRLHFPGALYWFSVCAGWLHAQPLQFTVTQRLTNNEIALTLAAPVGRAYRIETGTTVSDWNGLITFPTNATTSLQHTDSAAPYLSARFYRATQLTGSNIVAGDHLITTNGDVIIQARYHATFVMQWNGKMIYNDPDDLATYAGLPKADLILISHDHSDHFSGPTIDAVRGPNAQIVVPPYVYNNNLSAAQKALAIVLTNGASTNVMGLNIDAIPANNSYHPPGLGNGYVLTIGGKRIYISGDTGNTPEMRALTNIDVACLCINQPYTMTVTDATNAVRAFRPKAVYPYHYQDQGGATANAAVFKQRLGTDLGIEVRLRKWY
jgi:L-ascorbate metabolism protein UlaG (beta-lactamase superfamily)